jgi:hypothetical protein
VVAALGILRTRGTQPRKYQNSLVFVAADRTRLSELQGAIRQFLAWRSIKSDREKLNLDAHQASQVDTKLQQAEDGVRAKVPETYSWLLVPSQPEPKDPIRIEAKRMQSGDRLAGRAAKRMLQDATLATTYGSPNLRLDLDRIPLWRDGRIEVKALFDLYAQYVYLQRLVDPTVLKNTVSNGVSSTMWTEDGFAFADTYDQTKERFGGLVVRQIVDVGVEGRGYLVAPAVAKPQLERDAAKAVEAGGQAPDPGVDGQKPVVNQPGPAPAAKTRFYGRVRPNVTKLGSSVGQVAESIITHLQLLEDAEVVVTLDIRASAPNGIDPKTIRIITTNASQLKFDIVELE